MIEVNKSRFPLGKVVATPGAIQALMNAAQLPGELLSRHVAGEWGDLCQEDRQANEDAIADGSRILSVYVLKTGVKIWVITEAADENGSRAVTTILLPDEY